MAISEATMVWPALGFAHMAIGTLISPNRSPLIGMLNFHKLGPCT